MSYFKQKKTTSHNVRQQTPRLRQCTQKDSILRRLFSTWLRGMLKRRRFPTLTNAIEAATTVRNKDSRKGSSCDCNTSIDTPIDSSPSVRNAYAHKRAALSRSTKNMQLRKDIVIGDEDLQ